MGKRRSAQLIKILRDGMEAHTPAFDSIDDYAMVKIATTDEKDLAKILAYFFSICARATSARVYRQYRVNMAKRIVSTMCKALLDRGCQPFPLIRDAWRLDEENRPIRGKHRFALALLITMNNQFDQWTSQQKPFKARLAALNTSFALLSYCCDGLISDPRSRVRNSSKYNVAVQGEAEQLVNKLTELIESTRHSTTRDSLAASRDLDEVMATAQALRRTARSLLTQMQTARPTATQAITCDQQPLGSSVHRLAAQDVTYTALPYVVGGN